MALGAVVLRKMSLSEPLREIAIITVGAHYKAKFEFATHGPMAATAGVQASAIEAIRIGKDPGFTDAADVATYCVARELLLGHRLSDAIYADVKAQLGESALIELVTAVGYYTLISLTLNAFEVDVAPGMTASFPD